MSLLPEDDPARRDLSVKLGIGLAESGDLSRADALLADRIQAERRGRAFVAFHDGGGNQQVVTLDDERSPITIGRRPDNDIVLSWDSEVSRRHAHLLRTEEEWTLVDDESRNGSYLNGERVTQQRSLRDGDVFRFGDTVVLFRAPVTDEQRAAGGVPRARAGHLHGTAPHARAEAGGGIMGEVPANPPAGAGSVSELKARIDAERAGQPFLLYRDGENRQRLFVLEPGRAQASVGRRPSSDLVLDWDDQVSRLHAQLERVEEDWTIIDDGLSRNGTFVNGERLSGRRRLADGDTMRFGSTTFTFRSPQEEDQAGTAIAGESPVAVDLSTTQRRVLVALSRPYKEGTAFASPATNQQIADELFLSVDAVKTHLRVLFAKFGIEKVPQNQKRIRLVERAFYSGVISERDL